MDVWWKEYGLTTAQGSLYDQFETDPLSLTDRELVILSGIKASLSEYSSRERALYGMLMGRAGFVAIGRNQVDQFKATVKNLLTIYGE